MAVVWMPMVATPIARQVIITVIVHQRFHRLRRRHQLTRTCNLLFRRVALRFITGTAVKREQRALHRYDVVSRGMVVIWIGMVMGLLANRSWFLPAIDVHLISIFGSHHCRFAHRRAPHFSCSCKKSKQKNTPQRARIGMVASEAPPVASTLSATGTH
jgi:hypothetical protein